MSHISDTQSNRSWREKVPQSLLQNFAKIQELRKIQFPTFTMETIDISSINISGTYDTTFAVNGKVVLRFFKCEIRNKVELAFNTLDMEEEYFCKINLGASPRLEWTDRRLLINTDERRVVIKVANGEADIQKLKYLIKNMTTPPVVSPPPEEGPLPNSEMSSSPCPNSSPSPDELNKPRSPILDSDEDDNPATLQDAEGCKIEKEPGLEG